jgi:hypothetical protein
MSSYGSAGGYPSQPDPYQQANPYGGGQPPHQPAGGQGPYGPPPADPWGQGQEQGSWADLTSPQPQYGAPPDPPTRAYGDTTYQQPYADAYGQPYQQQYGPETWDQPPPRRRTGLTVALSVAAVLVLAAAVGITLFLVSGGDEEPGLTAPGTEQPDPGATGEEEPPGPDAPPEARIGYNATYATVDDCLVNDAGDADPQLRIVPCDGDEEGPVYQVLQRFDEQVSGETEAEHNESARQICAAVVGYQFYYRFIGPTEEDSFVLCLVEE